MSSTLYADTLTKNGEKLTMDEAMAASGLAEMATERLFGGFAGTDIGESVIDFTVKNPYIRKALNFATEPLEEVIVTAADPFFQRATVDKDAAFASLKDYGESAKQGVLLTTLMGIATYPIKRHSVKKTVDMLNTASESINTLLVDDKYKLAPLSYRATEEDMQKRQGEIKALTREYTDFVETEVSKFAEWYEAQSKTVPAEENSATVAENATVDTPSATDQRNTFTDGLDEIASTEMPTVGVGETFVESGSNKIIKVVGRDGDAVTVEITTASGTTETKQLPAKTVDSLAVNDRYTRVETPAEVPAESVSFSPSETEASRTGFVGEYTGKTYSTEEANLLSLISDEGIANAGEARPGAISRSVLGLSADDWQSFKDAGFVGDDGFAMDFIIMDERERRHKVNKNMPVSTRNTLENEDVIDVDAGRTMYDVMDELGLTYEEQNAILKYKSSESYKINRKLRKGIELSEDEKNLVQLLNVALDRFAKFQGVVYRNIGFYNESEFNEFISKHKGHNTIKHTGFTSASKAINGYVVDAEYKVHYKIQSKKAADVEKIGLAKEGEVLFKAGTIFIIKDMQIVGKTAKVILEEDTRNEINSTEYDGDNTQQTEDGNIKIEYGKERTGVSDGTSVIRGRRSADDRISQKQSNSNREGSDRENRRNYTGDDEKTWNDSDAERSVISSDVVESAESVAIRDRDISAVSPSQDIKSLENSLTDQGVRATSRTNIVNDAVVLEKTLDGTGKSVSQVLSGLRKLTNNVAKILSKKVGTTLNYYGLLDANLNALTNAEDMGGVGFISAYTDTYLEALQASNPTEYANVSGSNKNISAVLTDYIVTGRVPSNIHNYASFAKAANDIKTVVKDAIRMIGTAYTQIYGKNPSVDSKVQRVLNGDFSVSSQNAVLQSETANGIMETSTDAKISYALNGNADSDAQPGVMWTIEEGVLTKQEVALFYQEIAKLNHRGSKNYQMSSEGEYIFDIENKLIYTDGEYSYPTITKVISFDSEYENDILLAKELILNEEGTQSGIDDAIEVIEMLYGQGFVLQTNFEDSRTHAREVRGRKGTDSGATHRAGKTDVARAQGNGKISYALDESSSDVKKDIKTYTEQEYKDFGWARENGILSADQNADYRSKFAMAKSGQMKFPRSKKGEYIISVSDIYDSDKEGINNVLVFAKGTIDKPVITSIIEIYEYDETSLDEKRRYIYACERRGIQPEIGNVFERYNAIDFQDKRPGIFYGGDGDSSDNGYRGRSGRETFGTEREIGEKSRESKQAGEEDVRSSKDDARVSYALDDEYWHTDLTKRQVKILEECLRRVGKPSATMITDTANWYMGRIDGNDVFAIYSTEDAKGPTILYETKTNAKLEKNILTDILEVIENGESVDGKSDYVNWILSRGWLRQSNNNQNNLGSVGAGTNNKNAGVLSRQPKGNASRAFWNVIENLFRKQKSARSNEGVSYSLVSEVNKNEQRNLLSDGSQQRDIGQHSGEQVTGLAQATERRTKTAAKRNAYTKGLSKESLEERVLTDEEGNKHRYTEIKQEAWNEEMQNIAGYYGSKGVTVHFLKGNVVIAFTGQNKTAKAMRAGSDIYISYDNFEYSPQQLAMHEYIHSKYDTPEVQAIKDEIFSKLSTEERNTMLERVKSAYGDVIKDSRLYEEEVVCNILSGMYRSENCNETVQNFWTNENSGGQGYAVSQYAESIDAGGKSKAQKFKYLFIGDKAKTADLSALADAKKMRKAGLDAKTIWKETGWGLGLDGKWRSEITDNDAVLEKAGIFQNPDIKRFVELENKAITGTLTEQEFEEAKNLANVLKGVRKHPKYLHEFLKNDALFEAYPELADVEVVFEELDENVSGRYNPRENRIHISKFLNNAEALSTLLHEIQHAIQHIEGFETGINPEKALDFARARAAEFLLQNNDKKYNELIAKGNYAEIVDYIDQFIKKQFGLDDMNQIAKEIYWNSYGEKESRAVQERFENQLNEKERRENYPNNEKGAISKNEGKETYGGSNLYRHDGNLEAKTRAKVRENKNPGLDVREDAEATNGRRGEEGAGTSHINYALDENGMWEMEHIFENDDPEAEATMMQEWSDALEKHGTIPKGENPVREVDVPKKISKDKVVSRFARTMMEAGVTPDEVVSEFEERILDGTMTHEVITNERASANAKARIKENGFEQSLGQR